MAIDKTLMPQRQPPPAEEFHYYDRHPTREDLMGESIAQSNLLL